MGNRKLAVVIRRHCLTIWLMDDLNGAVSDTFHETFHNFIRRADLLNSDAVGGNLGIRTFTMGHQYRLHPTRFQAREDLWIKIMIGRKVKLQVGKGEDRRIAQN